MLGNHTLSGGPLSFSGDGETVITPTSVTTANPTIDSTVMVVNRLLAGDDVTAGNPVIDTTALVESTPVVAPDLTMGAPVVDTTAITQVHDLSAVYTGNAITVPNVQMVEDENFSAPNVLMGTVRIDAAVFSQDRIFSSQDLITGAPDVPTANTTINYDFSGSDVTSGNVEINTLTASIVINFTAPDISLGAPTVGNTTVTQNYALSTTELSFSQPTIDATSITVQIDFQSSDIITGLPSVGLGAFPFQITLPLDEIYNEVSVTPSIWTDTPEIPQETFTNAPAPSAPSFDETTVDNTDIWSEST